MFTKYKQALLTILMFLSGMAVAVGVFIFMLLVTIQLHGDNCYECGGAEDRFCCPCPNYDVMDRVSNWSNSTPTSPSRWAVMCNKYKEAHNVSFECFR